MIQVSSGLLKGVRLRSPRGPETRPSGERLRQGIFNVLRNFRWRESSILDGACVADVFAGTGVWGIEALSNGAGACWFVESSRPIVQVLRHNLDLARGCFERQGIGAPDARVLARSAADAYPLLSRARVLFCDPPYAKGWLERLVELEARHDRVVAGGLFLFEAATRERLDGSFSAEARLRLFDRKIYGDSEVLFFVKSEA